MARLRLNKWRSPKTEKLFIFVNGYEDPSLRKVAIVGEDDTWAFSPQGGAQVSRELANQVFSDVEDISGVRRSQGFKALCAAVEW
jgi:hypothetical protein